ncbi:MAG: type III-A CRISPR-associated protein Csm2 [Candidatus Sigynarchaeota archaeon]
MSRNQGRHDRRPGGDGPPGRQDQGSNQVGRIVDYIKAPNWQELVKEGGLVDNFARGMDELKISQMRKFFDEVQKCGKALKENKDEWEARLWQIVPLVKFSKGRKLCPDEFVDFISKGVAEVMQGPTKEDKRNRFDAFLKIFEATVAYQTYYKDKKKG